MLGFSTITTFACRSSSVALAAVRRVARLARDNLDPWRRNEFSTRSGVLAEEGESAAATHDEPVPSMRNWGSLTTNVHTSSHKRYVERWPWVSADLSGGYVAMRIVVAIAVQGW